ncbi:hypothetical protein, partial [Salipiger thiooxidans]|uniref:hypothetical protein n=1 Tax=Salipiger thiooxidans TaxID=282683 RepID=UPI001CD5B6D7
MNATQLATELGISKGRVSQYVAEGKLDGCFSGAGRARRFDVSKVRAALEQRLDPGQMLGNGASTKRRIRSGQAELPTSQVPAEPAPVAAADPAPAEAPMSRYEMARTLNAEEAARKSRRENMLAEGSLVLSENAGREAARALSRELAQVEDLLRRGARLIADDLGVDFKAARKILLDLWREHRTLRAEALGQKAAVADLDDSE